MMVRDQETPVGEILLYQSEDGRTKLDVRLVDRTVWLSQKQLTELFGKAKGTISEHIKHIFEDGELTREATVRLFRTVRKEGDREVVRDVEFYNLDMVLAPGGSARLDHDLAGAHGQRGLAEDEAHRALVRDLDR
ncbi:MAG TPA: hypothetical protein VM285_03330 [Polyangia bacterium]|nr:hypothetical protein [Polyangia bacterium]